MKRTSNKLLNYPGHIDCRKLSSDLDKLELESKLSVKLRAAWREVVAGAPPSPNNRSNLNSNFLIEVIND